MIGTYEYDLLGIAISCFDVGYHIDDPLAWAGLACDFLSLKDNGIVKVNTSGSDRPLIRTPNSDYKTENGEHIFIYDGDGKLIYDISSSRVKGFKINVDPNGVEHYQAYKLEGAVPDAIKELFGW